MIFITVAPVGERLRQHGYYLGFQAAPNTTSLANILKRPRLISAQDHRRSLVGLDRTMAISLYAALVILRDWCSERKSVRFSFIGRGITVSSSHGEILDISEKAFAFRSKHLTATVDVEVLPNIDFILLEEFNSVLPPQILKCLGGEEECALIFKGVAGEMAVILK